MMSKIRIIFRKIVKFFDKKIITPITKFFVWLTEKTKDKGKNFERILSRKSSLVILSLLIAVFIFFYVDTKSTTILETAAEVLYKQPVNVIYNEESYVIEGIPETVDITMIGRKSDLYLAKQLPVDTVDIDLKDLKPGTHKVTLKYKGAIDTINYKLDPSVATVVIYSKMSEVRTVSVDILNQDKLNSKLSISKVEIDRQEVIIKGPQYKLDKVATVKALVDINNIANPKEGTETLSDVQLIAYDEKGVVIDVEIVPSTVTAKVTISSPKKTVPVKVVPTGTVAFGKAISNITSSVESVTIYGDESTLADIKNITVEVDVSGLNSTKKYTATIKKRSGVRYISETSSTVTISVENEVTKEFSDIAINYENLDERYMPNAVDKEDKYTTVIVKGVESVIESLDEKAIKVYVDLKGYTPNNGETIDADVIVECDDVRLSCAPKVKKVSLVITRKS